MAPADIRYRSHGFRRGEAQELKESGAQWPIVASAGQRGGLSFRCYVDLSDELSTSVEALFIQPYNFESGEELLGHIRYTVGLPRRKVDPEVSLRLARGLFRFPKSSYVALPGYLLSYRWNAHQVEKR